jgi:hypothetical protein
VRRFLLDLGHGRPLGTFDEGEFPDSDLEVNLAALSSGPEP